MDCVFVSNLLACAFFMGDMSPFTIRDINDQWYLSPVNLVFIVGDVTLCIFSSLGFSVMRSSIVCVFVDVVIFLGLEFSF